MKIRDIRKITGLSQRAFADKYKIPLSTLQHWERDYTQPPKYYLNLLESSVGINSDVSYFKGKHGETYIYSSINKSVTNTCGDMIHVDDVFERIKSENAALYLSELFDSIEHAKKMFMKDCEEDVRSDIIWMEN